MEFLDINWTKDSSLLLYAIHSPYYGPVPLPEMEFLDINWKKDLRLLLYAIHSPFYWYKKTILFSGFKNPYKKSAKQEYSCLFMVSIL